MKPDRRKLRPFMFETFGWTDKAWHRYKMHLVKGTASKQIRLRGIRKIIYKGRLHRRLRDHHICITDQPF